MQEYNILEESGLSQTKERGRKEQDVDDIKTAERLDFSFYDGLREKGFGGYYYDGRWILRKVLIKENGGHMWVQPTEEFDEKFYCKCEECIDEYDLIESLREIKKLLRE